ncbi:hypothetical protein K3723_13990 [Leisingera caerulea]|uniref:hypothetical protein n=1 Tax=Leisingera caerulea TaxID=506591 RepID=UPI0021A71291|nr:hypothetical protein [Leisingera caerulea]UWQ61957.1 hypothetical protein K3723_13990 [Leisingera caerulea]
MMDSMMEKIFAGISSEEKQKMMTDMMPKMMEGMDMSQMMPQMMMGMMSGGNEGGSPGMKGMMGDFMSGSSGDGMPSMRAQMMPNCIRMMMRRMEPAQRRNSAEAIVKALVDEGSKGLSADERRAYLNALSDVLETAS